MKRLNTFSKILSLLMTAAFALGCSDNATRLSHAIAEFVEAGSFRATGSADELLFVPKSNPEKPYYLVFFPEHQVEQKELEAAGLPEHLAGRVFTEMAYVSIGNAPYLIVVQDGGEISFTTHWNRFASVPQILVIPGEGPVRIRIRPGADGAVVETAK